MQGLWLAQYLSAPIQIMIIRVSFLLDLDPVRDRNVEDLSGGELQRFACAVLCVQQADV